MSVFILSRGRSLLKTGTRTLQSFSVPSLTTRSQEPPGYRNVLEKRMIQDLRLTSFSVSSVVNKKVVQEVEQTNILDKYQGLLDTLNYICSETLFCRELCAALNLFFHLLYQV